MATPPILDDTTRAALAASLGEDPTSPRLARAVRSAEARMVSALHHPVVRVHDDPRLYDGAGGNVLRLGVLEPTLIELHIDGTPVPVDDVQVSRIGLARFRDGRPWPHGYANIRAILTHGLDPVPEDIITAVVEAVERSMVIPTGVKQASLGQASYTFGTEGTTQQFADVVARWGIGAGDRA